ncbi:MAG: gliding motility-associated C-terminal domain-containing protein [Ilyomonas sp.]
MRRFFILLLLCVFSFCSEAQLCAGSLGDPVVNITFGTDASPSASFLSTNYSVRYSDCPDDGYYTIESATANCHGDSWHHLAEDHTPGDTKGRMMVVNASYDPGDFYVDTVRNLCPATTYEFAAWVINLTRLSACFGNSIQPNLTFSIEKTDGTILKSFNSGNIPGTITPAWKQYGFYFITPADVSTVVIRLTNNAEGGCGNDLALDDITFRPCGAQVNASINGLNSDTVNLCEGDAKQFVLTGDVSSGYTNPAKQWQMSKDSGKTWTDMTGENNSSLTIKITAATPVQQYLYRLSVAEQNNIASPSCRVVSNVLSIAINPKPEPVIKVNEPVCEGSDLVLTPSEGAQYEWRGPDNFTSAEASPVIKNISQKNEGTYSVTITTAAGCVNNTSKYIVVNPAPKATASSAVNICEGASTHLQSNGGVSYTWSPATGLSNPSIANPIASPTDSIVYTVKVTDNTGCSDTASVAVNVLRKPVADAGPDKTMISGNSVQLEGSAGGSGVAFFWTPNNFIDNYRSLTPFVNPPTDTTYTLHVQSDNGCGTAEDKVFVRVYKKVIVPNAFSPNGDGINDVWKIEAIETYPNSDIVVFNRYGQAVTKQKGSAKPWDGTYQGKPLPVGTYYYVIDLKEGQGKLSGWVMILR